MYYSNLPETQAFASPNARGSTTPECRRRTAAAARAERRPRPTIGRTPARGACLHHHTAIGCLPWTEKKVASQSTPTRQTEPTRRGRQQRRPLRGGGRSWRAPSSPGARPIGRSGGRKAHALGCSLDGGARARGNTRRGVRGRDAAAAPGGALGAAARDTSEPREGPGTSGTFLIPNAYRSTRTWVLSMASVMYASPGARGRRGRLTGSFPDTNPNVHKHRHPSTWRTMRRRRAGRPRCRTGPTGLTSPGG